MDEDFVEFDIFSCLTDLIKLKATIEAKLAKYTDEYIWHQDCFSLNLHPSSSEKLFGKVVYGDNLDDEWFTVFLLLEASREFSDLVIGITDQDGEFLLISAAESLPEWLSPSTCLNRGALHIIPLEISLENRNAAVAIIRDESIHTLASIETQNQAFKRAAEFPAKIKSNIQKTRIIIPAQLAFVLQHGKHLMPRAVSAFYNRDLYSSNACIKMELFGPQENGHVTTTLEFTRTLYAQLLYQRCNPPQAFGVCPYEIESKESKMWELGMKLSCGFEILASQGDYAFKGCKKWELYKQRLLDVGYFKQEIPGSQEYRRLDLLAKAEFLKQVDFMDHSNKVRNILKEFNGQSLILNDEPEDSDDWLTIEEPALSSDLDNLSKSLDPDLDLDPEDYDDASSNEGGDDVDVSELGKLGSGFKEFLNLNSGLDGVEFVLGDDSVENNLASDNEESDDDPIVFNGEKYLETLRSLMEIPDEVPEDQQEFHGMESYMEALQAELMTSKNLDTFERDDEGNVDIDVNLVKNVLDSMDSANGDFGPFDGILEGIDVKIAR